MTSPTVECPSCDGEGVQYDINYYTESPIPVPCDSCHGAGVVRTENTMDKVELLAEQKTDLLLWMSQMHDAMRSGKKPLLDYEGNEGFYFEGNEGEGRCRLQFCPSYEVTLSVKRAIDELVPTLIKDACLKELDRLESEIAVN